MFFTEEHFILKKIKNFFKSSKVRNLENAALHLQFSNEAPKLP